MYHSRPLLIVASYPQFKLVAPYCATRDGADAAAPLVGQNPLRVRGELVQRIGGKSVAGQIEDDCTKRHVGSEREFGAGLRSGHDKPFG